MVFDATGRPMDSNSVLGSMDYKSLTGMTIVRQTRTLAMAAAPMQAPSCCKLMTRRQHLVPSGEGDGVDPSTQASRAEEED